MLFGFLTDVQVIAQYKEDETYFSHYISSSVHTMRASGRMPFCTPYD